MPKGPQDPKEQDASDWPRFRLQCRLKIGPPAVLFSKETGKLEEERGQKKEQRGERNGCEGSLGSTCDQVVCHSSYHE